MHFDFVARKDIGMVVDFLHCASDEFHDVARVLPCGLVTRRVKSTNGESSAGLFRSSIFSHEKDKDEEPTHDQDLGVHVDLKSSHIVISFFFLHLEPIPVAE